MEVPCHSLPQVRSLVYSRDPVYMLPATCESAEAKDVLSLIRDTTQRLKLQNMLLIYTGMFTVELCIIAFSLAPSRSGIAPLI